jgi:hypothetical protein
MSAMTRPMMAQTDYSEKWPVTDVGARSLDVVNGSAVEPAEMWRRCGR